MSHTFGLKGPLSYVLQEDPQVPNEVDDPLLANVHHGRSGSMMDKLVARLSHDSPIYKKDN